MIQVSYPGVYVQETPSGVRTITGVSTSVTAFVGAAARGPINKAVPIRDWASFERRFGGLSDNSELSFGVRQFFHNGGSEAIVVRLAKNAVAAQRKLQDAGGVDVLEITALDEGRAGNAIEVRVDHVTQNPASTFNLAFLDRAGETQEVFNGASMNGMDGRYVETLVNGVSRLVTVKRLASAARLVALPAGTSTSGVLSDVGTLLDANHSEFRLSVNRSPLVAIQLAPADWSGATPAARLGNLRSAIVQKVVTAAGGNPALSGLTSPAQANQLVFSSGVAGEASSVRVFPGERNDASVVLKLGSLNGGTEVDGAAGLRPEPVPEPGTLTSDVFQNTDLNGLPSAAKHSFLLTLDAFPPRLVDLGANATAGGGLGPRLIEVASRIEAAVRDLNHASPAYAKFTCVPDTTAKTLTLSSGSRGLGSMVVVSPAPPNDIADDLHLVTGATQTTPSDVLLRNGDEGAFTPDEAYPLFIADRSKRRGIYALEGVDLFNLLCLPGMSDGGILADANAYCTERRAMLIVDAPSSVADPDAMASLARGADLPKSENAAVFWPWIRIANPLDGSKLRDVAPSGTVAGLFARTDASRGVWKAPAGIEATLNGVQAARYQLTDGENGVLNPLGVNCIRVFPVVGAVSWGARTLRGADQLTSEYKYIPIKRLALYLEESLYRGTQWVVFEPNDEPLWAQIRLNLGAFMHGLFVQGAFAGKSPRDAYLVKCDRETTTPDDVNKGIVNILVGFAPLRPAEFVIIRIQQLAGQIQV